MSYQTDLYQLTLNVLLSCDIRSQWWYEENHYPYVLIKNKNIKMVARILSDTMLRLFLYSNRNTLTVDGYHRELWKCIGVEIVEKTGKRWIDVNINELIVPFLECKIDYGKT